MRRAVSIAVLTGALALAQKKLPESGSFMLRGGTIHTISGPVIENGSVLIRNGKIVGVGRNLSAPEGTQIIDLEGKQVYPGMIDSASTMGLRKSNDHGPSDAE